MRPREYCCCAIPLVNVGIYATLLEQFTLGVVVGTLSIATPSIVGAATPSIASTVLAIVAYVAAAVQVFGLIGVAREKAITFRRYVTLHVLFTFATFSVAIVWITISASRHPAAQSKCERIFFPGARGSATSSEGQTLCNIFPWIGIGIMGGLWLFLAAVQFYFYMIISSYSSSQQRDHDNFDSEYDLLNPDIPMTNSTSWGSGDTSQKYNHLRQDSGTTFSSVAFSPQYQQRQASSTSKLGYTGYDRNPSPFSRQPAPMSRPTFLEHPANAYTQDPTPTPKLPTSNAGSVVTAGVDRPKPSQAHPAEGSFRRKTPRLVKYNPNEMDRF